VLDLLQARHDRHLFYALEDFSFEDIFDIPEPDIEKSNYVSLKSLEDAFRSPTADLVIKPSANKVMKFFLTLPAESSKLMRLVNEAPRLAFAKIARIYTIMENLVTYILNNYKPYFDDIIQAALSTFRTVRGDILVFTQQYEEENELVFGLKYLVIFPSEHFNRAIAQHERSDSLIPQEASSTLATLHQEVNNCRSSFALIPNLTYLLETLYLYELELARKSYPDGTKEKFLLLYVSRYPLQAGHMRDFVQSLKRRLGAITNNPVWEDVLEKVKKLEAYEFLELINEVDE